MIEVPAAQGEPYQLDRHNGLIRLKRRVANGRTLSIVFGNGAAIAVADALVDLAEGAA